MENRANYTLIGAFAVGGVILMMLFALWIARASLNSEFAVYDVVFEGPARGIGRGTEVRFNGIRVGEVTGMRMDAGREDRVVARIRIGAQWPVRADGDARLEPVGLTGVNLIQISAGSKEKPLLRQRMGEPPPRIAARQGAIDELLESSEKIAANASVAVEGASRMLTTANAEKITLVLEDLRVVMRDLRSERGALQSLSRLSRDISSTSAEFEATAQEFALLARDSRARLAALETSAVAAFGDVGAAARSVDDAAVDVGSAASDVALVAAPELASAASELRRLSSSLDRIVGDLEGSPTMASLSGRKPTVRVAP